MVIQYPDTIIITREGSSTMDDNGDWITTPSEVIELKCRFVPNYQAQTIRMPDGTAYVFHYKIAFPKGTLNVRPRDSYEREGNKDIILQFEVGQLHSVAWV